VIPLTRGAVRSFLAVARRAAPAAPRPDFVPVVRIATGADEVILAVHFGRVVVACRCPAVSDAGDEVIVPLEALKALDGRADGPIAVEPSGPEAWTARWTDETGPHEAGLPLVVDCSLVWPAEPKKLWPVKPDFPAALHEAGRTAARVAPERYATDHVQVRGKPGQVVATDGKQALTLGGFTFPFPEDLLVPAVPVFGCKDLGREHAVSVGRTRDWLVLILGPWRVWLRIDRAGRFPDVAGATPKGVSTRVQFADGDADRLIDELPRLPGGNGETRPVTLDLAGDRVEARGRADGEAQVTTIPLPGSATSGSPTRLVLNRRHLGRALALGCRELAVAAPGKPLVFRGPDRTYLTVPLDPADAVPPTATDRAARALARTSPDTQPEPHRRIPVPTRDRPPPDRTGPADSPPEHPGPDAPDPLTEAEELKAALADALARTARLVAALRGYHRERRSLRAAWSSLRALNLGP
jgi:hypothetical protein